ELDHERRDRYRRQRRRGGQRDPAAPRPQLQERGGHEDTDRYEERDVVERPGEPRVEAREERAPEEEVADREDGHQRQEQHDPSVTSSEPQAHQRGPYGQPAPEHEGRKHPQVVQAAAPRTADGVLEGGIFGHESPGTEEQGVERVLGGEREL